MSKVKTERKAQRKHEKALRRKSLAPAKRRARRAKGSRYEMVFVNGKQKWVSPEPLIDGLTIDEFIAEHADPIWLHQNEMWELLQPDDTSGPAQPEF